jgi:hypothetical protein
MTTETTAQRMQDALGTNLAGLQWVVDLYALVFASFLLTGDRDARSCHRRWQNEAARCSG